MRMKDDVGNDDGFSFRYADVGEPNHDSQARQLSDSSSLAPLGLLSVAAILGFWTGSFGNQFVDHALKERDQLDDHRMCGIPDDGQAECWWDCEYDDGVVKNLDCLLDCFPTQSSASSSSTNQDQRRSSSNHCVIELIGDIKKNGTCTKEYANFWNVHYKEDCDIGVITNPESFGVPDFRIQGDVSCGGDKSASSCYRCPVKHCKSWSYDSQNCIEDCKGDCSWLDAGIDSQCYDSFKSAFLFDGRSDLDYAYGNVYTLNRREDFFGPVCDDAWDDIDATVVCTQLGYVYGFSRNESLYGIVSSTFAMDDVYCDGTETYLFDCDHKTEDDCEGTEAAGVYCLEARTTTPGTISTTTTTTTTTTPGTISTTTTTTTTTTPGTISTTTTTTTTTTPGTISTTTTTTTSSPIELQLQCGSYGEQTAYGNVFALNNNEYLGPVCDRQWGTPEATVVCKQLGYDYGLPTINSFFCNVPSTFAMDEVECDGNENKIQDCQYYNGYSGVNIRTHNCGPRDGAGVECYKSTGNTAQIQLQGGLTGDSWSFGNVFATINATFGPVCDDQWSAEEAAVVCRQLGFPSGTFDKNSAWSKPNDDSFSVSQFLSVDCTEGNEATIQDCQPKVGTEDETKNRCTTDDIAGVYCYDTTSYEPDRIELIGGKGSYEGNVFAHNKDGYFGPICDELWGETEANVTCRTLGFLNGRPTMNSEFGPVPRKFAMSNVVCNDDSVNIQNCAYDVQDKCDNSNGAGVRCSDAIGGGTCSEITESLLYEESCKKDVKQLPRKIQESIELIIKNSCNAEVIKKLNCFLQPCDNDNELRTEDEDSRRAFYRSKKRQSWDPNQKKIAKVEKKRKRKNNQSSRFNPIEEIVQKDDGEILKIPDINFTHTRNRYPWICSLRTRGISPEHLCAVTLLSVPPKPTVLVSAAHCTYICKDRDGIHLDSCCCSDSDNDAGNDCNDQTKCGNYPKVYEMTGVDCDILCGEWQTGPFPKVDSKEKYNIVLDIQKIVRHPNFGTNKDEGTRKGSDIAVFKINEKGLQNNKDIAKLRPICLPRRKNESIEGAPIIHAGWARPPPFSLVTTKIRNYFDVYSDLYKMWHFKMQEKKCKDSQNGTDSFYPAGLTCALEEGAGRDPICLTAGESGSPLMKARATKSDGVNKAVKEGIFPPRYFAEGILSFTRSCRIKIGKDTGRKNTDALRLISTSPNAYTKLSCFLPWVAAQYDMTYDYEEEDPKCTKSTGNQSDYNKKDCYADLDQSVDIPTDGPNADRPCIFPFYYDEVKYDKCISFTASGYTVPSYYCPVYESKLKKDGESAYPKAIKESSRPTDEFCILPGRNFSSRFPNLRLFPNQLDNQQFLVDPSDKSTCENRFKDKSTIQPFAQCKNNCRGVREFGVIALGGALAFGTSTAAIGLLAPLLGSAGLGVVGVGAVGGGLMVAQSMCATPYCETTSGQCCLLVFSVNGLICPTLC